MQLYTRIPGSKSPSDRRFGGMALDCIRVEFALACLFIRDAAIQTRPAQHTQLQFSPIEPTPMCGRLVQRQPCEQASGFCRLTRLVQRSRLVGVQVIPHDTDHLGIRRADIDQPLPLVPDSFPGAWGCSGNVPPAYRWFAEEQAVACAVAAVVVVRALCLAWLWWQGGARLGHQRLTRLINVDLGPLRIIRFLVEVADVLHGGHTLGT